MSVVLEKDKIIIIIPTGGNPEEALTDTIDDIIFAMQHFDLHCSCNFYHLHSLLQAMIPDRNTYKYFQKGYNVFNAQPLRLLIEEASAIGIIEHLNIAVKYLNTITASHQRDLDLEDATDHIKGIIEAIEKGMAATK